jgi:hypothetical protein
MMIRPRLVIEYETTRDAHVPLYEGADMDDTGYRCIPIPPDDSGRWELINLNHSDKRSRWRRIRLAEDTNHNLA